MPNLRELRSRIRSIESTSRVTKALQMIAAAKMKKAQDKVLEGRAYSEKLNSIIANVYESNPEVFLTDTESVSEKSLILLVTPDRGLCGALVSNILKEASKFIESMKADNYEIRVIGKKGTSFVSKLNNEYESFKVSDNLGKVSKALIPRYVETSIFNSILDSVASEHSARLVAMQNATDNANELKEDLTLDLNKARQQQVTSEILDIIGGALALED